MINVTKLTVRNLGPVADAEIDLAGKPLVIFYGEVRQGKTTLLNAVRWALGGEFPDDIIRHGADTASARLDFIENGVPGWVSRSWYLSAKDGTLNARPVEFVRGGEKAKGRVVDAVKALLNPFQLNQSHFANMTEQARRKYMAELFGTSDAKEDAELLALDSKAKELRAVLTGFGEIDLTEPPPLPNVFEIKQKLDAAKNAHTEGCRMMQMANAEAVAHNAQRQRGQTTIDGWTREVAQLEARLTEIGRAHV